MKFEFPTFRTLIKTILISLLLAVVGYFVIPKINIEQISAQRLFSYGVLIGGVLVGLLVSLRIYAASNTEVESIFVGNLAFKATPNALRKLFEDYGDVHAVRLMTDRATRRPRGFGFVEMTRKDARKAIRALDGTEFYGRELKVNIANERKNSD